MRKYVTAIVLVSITAFAQTALKGTAIFGSNGIYSVKLESWISSSVPRLLPNTTGLIWPRFSPDGKLIAALSGGKVSVIFNDGSGKAEVATDACSQGAGNEHVVVEWVKTTDGSYEISYAQQSPIAGIKSVVVLPDFTAKTISKGTMRVIAQNIGSVAGGWMGMSGGYDVVDAADGTRRILTRSNRMGELNTMPNKNTTAQSGCAYSWPAKNNPGFYEQADDGHLWPHSCFHGISRDGAWAQFNQNIHVDDEWPGEKGDHLGFILCPWQMPVSISQTNFCTTLPYILFSTPSTMGATKVRNYHWTNDKTIIVAAAQSGGSYYVIQLASYPPVAVSGKNGSAVWTPFPLPGSSEPWGCDLWVGDLPDLSATGVGTVRARTAKAPVCTVHGRTISLADNVSARIVDARGITVARTAFDGSGSSTINVRTPGTYFVVVGSLRRTVVLAR